MNNIDTTLSKIQEQSGLRLTLCDYFTGIRNNGAGDYFNVILSEDIYLYGGEMCHEYMTLGILVDEGIISDVAPNGIRRVAIYF